MCNGPICRAIAAAAQISAVATPQAPNPTSTSNTSPANPKPFKVLKIKYGWAGSPLLRLPREVRDMIYFHTLAEPRRWDKRHAKNCVYHFPHAPAQFPPYRLPELDLSPCWIRLRDNPFCQIHGSEDLCHRERCNELCLKRQGLTLLRTNKQIYDEADPIFWRNLTVCFDDAEILLATLRSLPEDIRGAIRGVSFMKPLKIIDAEVDSDHGANLRAIEWLRRLEVKSALMTVLGSMVCLTDLELPAEYFDMLRTKFVGFSSLRHLRCTTTESIFYPSPHPSNFKNETRDILLDVALTRRFDPKGMGEHECEYIICDHCHDFFQRIGEEGHQLDDSEVSGGVLWEDEVVEKLSRWQPSHNAHVPYTLPITLNNGVECRVKVWGLPSNDWKARQKLLRDSAAAKIGVVPRSHPTVKCTPSAEDSDGSFDGGDISMPAKEARSWRRFVGQQAGTPNLDVQRRTEQERRDVEQDAARQDKYESGGYEIVEAGSEG